MNNTETSSQGFSGLGIAPALLETLAKLKFSEPTPIQRQAIPIAIQGKDVVGIAQTGTGKTLAFGIPLIQRLHQISGRALIVLPTRELASQVDEALRRVGGHHGLRTAVIIGGVAMQPQVRALASGPHVIIATPGRLNDHLQHGTARLSDARIVVLDEADRMLDMGFAPQIKKIFQHLPAERQTMLFSATMPPEIMKMATTHMKIPIRIEVAPAGTTADRVTQEIFVIPRDQKIRLTEKLLEQYQGTTLIFTRTKYGAKKLTRAIRDMGHSAAELHSNRSLGQRREALAGFKSGKYRVLIATDIASRGIDVTGIELVLNFDLPMNSEDYVHRIGRTARASASGHAISFAMPDQRKEVRDIERLVRKNIPITKTPELPAERAFRPSLPTQENAPRRQTPRRPEHASASHRASMQSSQPPRRSRAQSPQSSAQGSFRGDPRSSRRRGSGHRRPR